MNSQEGGVGPAAPLPCLSDAVFRTWREEFSVWPCISPLAGALPSWKVTTGVFFSASAGGPAAVASGDAAGTGAPAEFAPAPGGLVMTTDCSWRERVEGQREVGCNVDIARKFVLRIPDIFNLLVLLPPYCTQHSEPKIPRPIKACALRGTQHTPVRGERLQ